MVKYIKCNVYHVNHVRAHSSVALRTWHCAAVTTTHPRESSHPAAWARCSHETLTPRCTPLRPWPLLFPLCVNVTPLLTVLLASHGICPFVTGLLHSAWWLQASPMQPVSEFPPFLRLYNVPMCVQTTLCYTPIHPWPVGCFCSWAVPSNAAGGTQAQTSTQGCAFSLPARSPK